MSPLVTRPSLPEPGTVEGSTPLSPASRRTEGACPASAVAGFAGGGGSALADFAGSAFSSGLTEAAGVFAGADGLAAGFAPAPSWICPSSAPTATVSPSLTAISESTPAAGAGTSIVTLSVSSSTSGSSTATASPACLNHLPMVASVTDSPSVGTRISAMTSLSSPSCRARPGHPRLHSIHAARRGARHAAGPDAGGRGGDLQRHLVGLKLDQRLVHGDGVADLLQPVADGGLGHRLAEGWNPDFSRH
jgi:hypothetical protein